MKKRAKEREAEREAAGGKMFEYKTKSSKGMSNFFIFVKLEVAMELLTFIKRRFHGEFSTL